MYAPKVHFIGAKVTVSTFLLIFCNTRNISDLYYKIKKQKRSKILIYYSLLVSFQALLHKYVEEQ